VHRSRAWCQGSFSTCSTAMGSDAYIWMRQKRLALGQESLKSRGLWAAKLQPTAEITLLCSSGSLCSSSTPHTHRTSGTGIHPCELRAQHMH